MDNKRNKQERLINNIICLLLRIDLYYPLTEITTCLGHKTKFPITTVTWGNSVLVVHKNKKKGPSQNKETES